MKLLLSIAGVIWASPYTLLGLLIGSIGLLFGGHVRVIGRGIEFYGGGIKWFVHRLPNGQFTLALTLGHVILGQTDASLDILCENGGRFLLEFESSYGLSCMLNLQCGRRAKLESLDQQMTYAGLMEGTPDKRSNDRSIQSSLSAAAKLCVPDAVPFLIPPRRRDYLRVPNDMSIDARLSPNRFPEWLPLVRCIASLTDIQPARDRTRDFSALVVMWYQDEFAFPIDPYALESLRNLDWDALATDVDY